MINEVLIRRCNRTGKYDLSINGKYKKGYYDLTDALDNVEK